MKYELNEEQIDRAKFFIRKLKKDKKSWTKEKEKAEEYLKKCPDKYYLNTKKRIIDANKQIEIIDRKIKDLKDLIKKGYINI